jgi:prepilin-type N-terminal cleavage/methylation domain-containing protein
VNSNMNTKEKQSGFTLAELLLVVVIIVLLAGAGGRMFVGSLSKMKVEKYAKELMLAAKYARLTAVEKQERCSLLVDKENNRFCLLIGNFESTEDGESGSAVSNEYSRPCEFDDGISFEEVKIVPYARIQEDMSEEGSEIVFKPNGSSDTASVQIGDGKNHYTVYILAATGKARIQFGEAEESPVDIVDLDMIDG